MIFFFMKFCTFWRQEFTKLTIFKAPKMAQMTDLELLNSPKLISHKIWETEKSWNFHTVYLAIFLPKKIGNTAHPLLMEENIILDVRSHKSHEKQKSSLYPINYIEGGLNLSLFFSTSSVTTQIWSTGNVNLLTYLVVLKFRYFSNDYSESTVWFCKYEGTIL